ncbi:MAG: citrate synthase [Candidatus Thermoplasmatota archaeon]|nr:citrate synthase [Candidatus Thermoplasmatota archaeon]
MPDDQEVHKGLEGIIVNETKIGYVDGQKGRLVYRGYDIETLASKSNFEEVSYLLINGKLPSREQFSEFNRKARERMKLPGNVVEFIEKNCGHSHPMSDLRTVVSFLGALDANSNSSDLNLQKSMGEDIIFRMPGIVAAIKRKWEGKSIIEPLPDLGMAANFLYMSSGRKPTEEEEKVMDTCLILHADHGSNASTFSSMVTISTLADMYSALTAGIATLKGPLHGGANEQALKMIKRVGSPENAERVIGEMLGKKEKVMGFGHRVYKVYDPRARILKEFARSISAKSGKQELFETAEAIEKAMISKVGGKGIFPNVDFYSGMVYESLGFEENIFTPIFAFSRSAGWVARSLEYVSDNRLFRPRSKYSGEMGPIEYVPLEKR